MAAAIVALLALVVSLFGIPARATYGARTTSDEPQYLLSALSLAEDGDLDIADELRDRRYTPFHDVDVDPQTVPLGPTGRQFSPHDPLLPLLLAPAMGLGGWPAAKATMALLGALTAGLAAWTAVRRFRVRWSSAAIGVGAFAVGAPLSAYATQIYPEIPAALCLVAIVAAALAPRHRTASIVVILASLIALPWLSVKYVPVAAVAGLFALWPLVRGRRWWTVGIAGSVLALAGLAYVVVHQRIYGGWTVYAAGDHFVETGQFSVVGTDPDYAGRTRRLAGLLVDRRYGLVAWAPVWILAPAAIAWLAAGRGRGARLLVACVLTGWLVATFVALTMHGWWSPGRQVVVVAPLVSIAVSVMVDEIRWLRWPVVLGGALGAATWIWLALEASTGRRTLVVDFFETSAPVHRMVGRALSQGWPQLANADLVLAVWTIGLMTSASVAYIVRRQRTSSAARAGDGAPLRSPSGC